MTTRLEQFHADLANTVAQANAVKTKSPYDIARDVLNAPLNLGAIPAESLKAPNSFDWNPVHGVMQLLDYASRPLQAVEASIGEMHKQANDQVTDPGNVWNKAFGAFTGSDPYSGNELWHEFRNQAPDEESDWINGVLGFTSDVFLDPLTYVPPAWILKGLKIAGKLIPGANSAANVAARAAKAGNSSKLVDASVASKIGDNTYPSSAFPRATPTVPTNAAAPGANVTVGTATDVATHTAADDVINSLTPIGPTSPADVGKITRTTEPLANDPWSTRVKTAAETLAEKTAAKDVGTAIAPTTTLDTLSAISGGESLVPETAGATAVADILESLKDIPGGKPTAPGELLAPVAAEEGINVARNAAPTPDVLAPLTELQIPKYTAEQIPDPFHLTPATTTELSVPVEAQMLNTVVEKIVESNLEKFGMYANEEGTIFKKGTQKTVTQDEFDAAVEKAGQDPTVLNNNITGLDAAGNEVDVPAGTFAKSLETGVSTAPAGVRIPHDGEFQDIHQVTADLHDQFNTGEAITKTVQVPEKRTPFTKEERVAWRAHVSKSVAPEDLQVFGTRNVHQYAAYRKNVDKVLALKRPITTISQLQQAVKNGQVKSADLKKLMKTLGVRSLDEAAKKFSGIEAKISAPEARSGVELAPGRDTPVPAESPSAARTEAPEGIPGTIPEEVVSQLAPEPVMSPNDIVTHAQITGDTSIINGDKAPVMLTMEQKNDVFEALKHTGFNQFTKEGLAKHIHETKGGAITTSPVPYGGTAYLRNNFNAYKTLTLWNGLLRKESSIWKRLPEPLKSENIAKLGKGTKEYDAAWEARASFLYDEVVPELKAAELTIKSYGLEPTLGKTVEDLPMSLHDTITALPRSFVEKYLFAGVEEGSRHIPPTYIMKMARETLYNVYKNGPDALLVPTSQTYAEFRNGMTKILKTPMGASDETSKVIPFQKWINKGIHSKDRKLEKFAAVELSRVIQSFAHAAPRLQQTLNSNWARLAMEKGTYIQALSADVTKRFGDDALAAMGNSTSELALIDNLDKVMEAAVREAGKIPPPGVIEGAIKPVLIDEANKVIPVAEAKAEIESAKAVERAEGSSTVPTPPKESTIPGPQPKPTSAPKPNPAAPSHAVQQAINKITIKNFDDATHIVNITLGTVQSQGMYRLFDIGEHLMLSGATRTLRVIFPHLSNEALRPLMLNAHTAVRSMHTEYRAKLNKFATEYSRTEQQKAWIYYQNGTPPTAILDPRMSKAVTEFHDLASWTLNPEVHSALGIMNRVSATAAQINRHMDRYGLGDKYHFDGRKTNQSMLGWKDWQGVDDPLDVLSKVNAAVFAAHAENLIGASISRMGSKTAFAGGTRITSSAKNTIIDKVIDTSLYYPEDLAKQMMVFDRGLQEVLKPEATNAVLRYYDGGLKTLKTHYTIYRLGHHVRNTIGDMWLSYMAGMTDPRYYSRGHDVLAAKKELYQNGHIGPSSKKANDVQLTLMHRGKKITLTNAQVYEYMKSTGNLPDMSVIEDISDSGNFKNFTEYFISGKGRNANPLRVAEIATGGKVKPGSAHAGASKLSEVREHSMRAPHWLFEMEKKHKTLDPNLDLGDALAKAANETTAEVRKWHPDGSDLTTFERKYLRRTVLFYSWMRKAIPIVMYSFLIRPARFTQYNKAMTEFAQSNNIDTNFGEPFPADQLFPQWLQDSAAGPVLGQAGNYFGINPGIPGMDVLSSYGPAGIQETSLGGLTPAIKIPGQVITHQSGAPGVAQNWQTGGNYGTWVDLLKAQVPNMGIMEKVAGMKVPGSSPEAPSNAGYESQLNLPGGITLGEAQLAGINWATGLGIADQSKPSYIVSALRERQKQAQAAGKPMQ